MNSDDVNDRKLKLSNIIQKITDSQLMKIKEAENEPCLQEVKFAMNPQKRENEIKKSIRMAKRKERAKNEFAVPVGFNAEVGPSTHEVPEKLSVSPSVTM